MVCVFVWFPYCIPLFGSCADPGISSCVEELFEALSLNPGCHNSLHSQFFPTAVEILGSLSPQMNLGLVAVSFSVSDVCSSNFTVFALCQI